MYLAQSTRKDSSGEGLIGLVDGAQAIIMTLLVLEMPILIIELVEHAKDSRELFFNLTMDIFGYFLAALIIYDIWSIQKSLFQSTKSSASQNLSCISSLWLATLIPPMLYIAEHFAQISMKDSVLHEVLNGNEVLLFRTITIFIVLATLSLIHI